MSFFNEHIEGDCLDVIEFFAIKGRGMQHILSNALDSACANRFHASKTTIDQKARRHSIRTTETAFSWRPLPPELPYWKTLNG